MYTIVAEESDYDHHEVYEICNPVLDYDEAVRIATAAEAAPSKSYAPNLGHEIHRYTIDTDWGLVAHEYQDIYVKVKKKPVPMLGAWQLHPHGE